MEIIWYGQSMFKIKGKTSSLIIDPFDPEKVNLKFPKDIEADVVLVTHQHADHNYIAGVKGNPLIIDGPGEYEKSGVSITGIHSFHDSEGGSERGNNTIYNIFMDGMNVMHLGDLGHLLVEEQTSQIDNVDILLVPTGGTYTIDAEVAAKVVAQLEPRIVIPMHFQEVEPFLKEMGAENTEPLPKLSITKDKLPEETQVVVLGKS